MVDISFIIVSWNARDYLKQCLDSIYATSSKVSFEIIVVDNNSSDGSQELVEQCYSEVMLIKNDGNLGFAKANNIGINASSGKYLCLVNSDVIILDKCIENLFKFMNGNNQIGMAGPRILNPNHSLQVSCRQFPSIWNNLCQIFGLNKLFPKSAFFSDWFMKYWQHDTKRQVDVISGCFWIIRKYSLNNVGLLDEAFFFYGEDIDWCKRFHAGGWEVCFFPSAQAIHYGGASSRNAPIRFYLEMQKADLRYWRKHHGILGETCYRGIIILRQLVRMSYYATRFIFSLLKNEDAIFKLKRGLACILFALALKDITNEQ